MLGAWLVATLVEVTAPNEPSRAELPVLTWIAPTGCPDEGWLTGEVESFLDGPLDAPRAGRFEAHGEVERTGETFILSWNVATDAGRTEERHEDPDCSRLARIAALKTALTLAPQAVIDRLDQEDPRTPPAPIAVESPPSAPASAPASAPPEPATPPTLDTGPAVIAPAKDPWVVAHVGVHGAVGWGLVPGVGGGLGLSGGALGPRWRAEVRGSYWPARLARAGGGAGADVGAAVGSVLGCAAPPLGPIAVQLCMGAEAGAVWARGVGTDPPLRPVRPIASAVLGTGVVWRSRFVAVWIRPEVVIPFTRPGFRAGPTTLWDVAPVGARAALGVDALLPRR